MARIRSIHPSLFTDEEFMSLSLAARVVLPGLWTECDDQGVFAWKPLTLKARILPADNCDMNLILHELEQAGFLTAFVSDGKDYGAVRNFRKFQRPKKPTNIHPLPSRLRTYVGLSDDSSPPVPHQDGNASELSPQMEDGGDKMEEEGGESKGADARIFSFDEFWEGYPLKIGSSKKVSRSLWDHLAPEKQAAALDSLPALQRQYAADKSWWKPALVENFLRAEKFESYELDKPPDPDEIARRKDAADRMMGRGKYAPSYQ